VTLDSLGTWRRTSYCGEIRGTDSGKTVIIMGWVHRIRDHGGVIFIDLRDRAGIAQVVCNPTMAAQVHEKAQELHNEYVIAVRGTVAPRPEGTVNADLPTGDVEVMAEELRIIAPSATLPFQIDDDSPLTEQLRLTYRYLDLRRPSTAACFTLRHKATQAVREFFCREGFLELETPFLTKSTPEGARDYVVPSRVNPGSFYALPQSPQLFKQLFMVAGMDRYFQIVRCFRDEDLRADRQPEFTQIDVEMSFVDRDDVMDVAEAMMVHLFSACGKGELPRPFPRITYADAMERYGSDKPDLRFDLPMIDCSDLVASSEFKVFREVVAGGGEVRGLNLPDADALSRSEIDSLVVYAQEQGAAGMAWIRVKEGGEWQSPLAKFFSDAEKAAIMERLGAKVGSLMLFMADKPDAARRILGAVRLEIGRRRGLMGEGTWAPLWVLDFPLVEYDAEEKRYIAMHHPFTSPMEEDVPLLATDPLRARARAYDMVMNGQEVGGGSIRIHTREVQAKLFELLGHSEEEAKVKFGFLLQALEFGAPPHGGIAFGFDRLVAMIAGVGSIRDVIPFPKTQKAFCPLTSAPSTIDAKQLRELSLKTTLPAAEKK
jgi:aspartyl-tRNA synthetase